MQSGDSPLLLMRNMSIHLAGQKSSLLCARATLIIEGEFGKRGLNTAAENVFWHGRFFITGTRENCFLLAQVCQDRRTDRRPRCVNKYTNRLGSSQIIVRWTGARSCVLRAVCLRAAARDLQYQLVYLENPPGQCVEYNVIFY